MEFSRVVGNIDPKLVISAQEKLTRVFLELGAGQDNSSIGSLLGGDALVFALVVPAVHILTDSVPTAATNGKQFFWSERFIASKSLLGLRLTVMHESLHALYNHPNRIGNRNLDLWRICVDYVANGMVFDDLRIRFSRQGSGKNAEGRAKKAFIDGLGNYATLDQFKAMLRDPKALIPGMEKWRPEPSQHHPLPSPDNEKELTAEEKAAVEGEMVSFKYLYADPNIPEELRTPEKIYGLLLPLLHKCPDCGKLGMTPPPASHPSSSASKSPQSNDNGDSSSNKPGDQAGSKEGAGTKRGDGDKGTAGKAGGCGACSGGFNVLDFGSTLDTHMDSVESEEELTKRVSDAVEAAKAMAGNIPGALVEALGQLSKPRISFVDVIRTQLSKSRAGNQRNDWSRWRSRPLAFGMLVPKKKGSFAKGVVLLDTSASMSQEMMALGVSQLASLDDRAELTIVCCDTEIRWGSATKIRGCKTSELSTVKVEGRGGTMLAPFFEQFQKKLGAADFIITITDGVLDPRDREKMQQPPKVPVYWLVVGAAAGEFKPPFGRAFDISEYLIF